MKILRIFFTLLPAIFVLFCAQAAAQSAQLPITVTKEKKVIAMHGEDEATKKDPAVAEYMKVVANEMTELYKTQELGCSWGLYLKLIDKGKFKLIEITLEDKDNSSAANRIIKTSLPTTKEEYDEQAKAAAKRIAQLLTCTPKS